MAKSQSVVGIFDKRSEAESAVRELINSSFRREDVSLIAGNASGEYTTTSQTSTGTADEGVSGTAAGATTGAVVGGIGGLLVGVGALAIPGIGPVIAAGPLVTTLLGAGVGAAAGGLIGALIDAGVPEEEAGYYAEGIRRGSTLVSVRADDQMMIDRAVNIFERHNAIDIDRRAEEWRKAGWTGFDPNATSSTSTGQTARTQMPSAATSTGTRRASEKDTAIPVIEEELQVGKRAVSRGGVRVYSHMVEKPVNEQVQLREETVKVERRPVNRPVNEADMSAFKEGTIEMRETDEEAIVGTRARVKEEVVVSKDVNQRTETVSDKVRRTEVEVEKIGPDSREQVRGYDGYESDFRNNFNSLYASRGHSYGRYEPAYRYGCTLAGDTRYAGKDWSEIEADARRDWETRNHGAWEDFKDSIRYAWDRVRGYSAAEASARTGKRSAA
jgi:uncharacterized protein (TIGR02271 family)